MTHITYTVRVCLSVALLLFLPTFLQAQVTVSATDHVVQPEEVFTVDIKVKGFTDILASQFIVSWDPQAFEFRNAENINEAIADYEFEHFGFDSANEGRLRFMWGDLSIQGVSIEDDSTLFSIELKAIQEERAEFRIGFPTDDLFTQPEIADINENILDIEFVEGTVTIDGISNVLARNASKTLKIHSTPNPFHEKTQVEIEFFRPTSARITIYDPKGAALYQESANFQSGHHALNFSQDIFTQPGVYLVKVESDGFLITHKMIAI